MAKSSVYLETSIPSYLKARPSRDLVIAARQQITNDWWELRRADFALHISQLVLDEAGQGDRQAAAERLAALRGIPILDITEPAVSLAETLLQGGVLPERAARDALYVAVACVHGIDFFLTWNCAHLANAETMGTLADAILSDGYEPPVICTPDELMGDYAWPEIPL